jgi:tetratricopeptide (TPR) repeat protein
MVVRAQGKAGEAQHLCQSTVVEARQLGLDQWLAHPLFVLAIFARDRGDTHQAESLITECLVRLDGTGEDDLVAQCHNFLAEIALRQKKLAQARAHLDVSLPLLQHRGVKRLEMATRRLLGELAAAEDRSEEAERIYAQGLSMFDTDQLNDTMGQAQMLFSRARLLVQLHRAQDAVRVLEASLALFTRLSHPRGILGVSWWLFKLYVRQCHWLRALCLIPPVLRTARAANLLTPRQLLAVLHRRPL